MSWESTLDYYRLINEKVKAELGGLHSARIVLVSVDFDEIEALQSNGDWQKAGDVLAQAAINVQAAGADFFLICTNTMHKVAEQVQRAVHIPLCHIADATAMKIKQSEFNTVGLLGTAFTMEQSFYKGRLIERHGLEVLTPTKESRRLVHKTIYEELCLGQVLSDSKQAFIEVVQELRHAGAQAVILGCTEISMLINQNDTCLPLFDTTEIHAGAAVEMALNPM